MTTCVLSWLKPNSAGYAQIGIDGDRQLHHRRVLECKLGRSIKSGMVACHTRMLGGHPRNCIRPDHLYEGTRSDNQRDSVADGTHNTAGTGSSQHLGVSWNKRKRRWQAHIRVDGKTQYLGYFEQELAAAEAYQEVSQRQRHQ